MWTVFPRQNCWLFKRDVPILSISFILQCCALSFIETMSAESVNMDPEEFDAYFSGRAQPPGSWQSSLLMCEGLQVITSNWTNELLETYSLMQHCCQIAIARFLDHMCLALWASGLWLRYAALQNLIPSFPWIAPPCPPPWHNPRRGRDQILQRSVAEP